MSYIRKIVITLCLLSGMCASQTVGSSDQATIRLLVEQVKELQESVKALQAKQMSPPVASPEAPPAEPVPPQPIEEAVAQRRLLLLSRPCMICMASSGVASQNSITRCLTKERPN